MTAKTQRYNGQLVTVVQSRKATYRLWADARGASVWDDVAGRFGARQVSPQMVGRIRAAIRRDRQIYSTGCHNDLPGRPTLHTLMDGTTVAAW